MNLDGPKIYSTKVKILSTIFLSTYVKEPNMPLLGDYSFRLESIILDFGRNNNFNVINDQECNLFSIVNDT